MELSNTDRQYRNSVLRDFWQRMGDKSRFEAAHATRVAIYSVATGERMGLGEDALLELRYAAELHDLGKLEFSDDLFTAKPVLELERKAIFDHPHRGAAIVAEFTWLEGALPAIRTHHERWDGAGYPDLLEGDQICLAGRILAVAEAFDAMTMPCGWNSIIPEESAIAEIIRCAGSQFDPAVVASFLQIQPIVQPVGL